MIYCAEKLEQATRASDTVARIGGDEFVILMENLDDISNTEILAKKIIQTFSQPVSVENQSLEIHASIGIACYPKDANNQETLLSLADHALYKAKHAGKNNFKIVEQI